MANTTSSSSRTRSRNWPEHLANRQARVRAKLNEADLDAILITHDVDIRYLTGFIGHDSWLLLTEKHVTIISDFRYEEALESAAPLARAIIRQNQKMTEALLGVLTDAKVSRIGYQADQLTADQLAKLTEAVGEEAELVSTSEWLIKLRATKDRVEIRAIKRALQLAEQAFEVMRGQIREGMTEYELVALLEYNLRWLGGEGTSFDTIVAIGPHASLPHYQPARGRVRVGYPILIDFGTRSEGYCSDLTRMLTPVRFKPKIEEIYPIVLKAQAAAIEAIAPGKSVKDIDAVARKVIADHGYGDHFGHGLGHGVGLDIHEQPVLSPRGEGVLEPGHVVTVEPGIYLPGIGGVRIEDMVQVTEYGHTVLSSLNKDAESAII